jgi:hypothetical protein
MKEKDLVVLEPLLPPQCRLFLHDTAAQLCDWLPVLLSVLLACRCSLSFECPHASTKPAELSHPLLSDALPPDFRQLRFLNREGRLGDSARLGRPGTLKSVVWAGGVESGLGDQSA